VYASILASTLKALREGCIDAPLLHEYYIVRRGSYPSWVPFSSTDLEKEK